MGGNFKVTLLMVLNKAMESSHTLMEHIMKEVSTTIKCRGKGFCFINLNLQHTMDNGWLISFMDSASFSMNARFLLTALSTIVTLT